MAETRPTVMMIAGEPSGDLLGARLIASLREKLGTQPDLVGVGGPAMAAEGLPSLFPMSDLSLMGVFEVLPKAARILARVKEAEILAHVAKPNVLVTIDVPAFNLRVAGRLRGLGIPIVHMVAPQVWAWRSGRAIEIAEAFDHLMALLPFEPPYFEAVGLKTDFIGHPVVESGLAQGDGAAFRARHGIAPEAPVLLVLPGSRGAEVKRLGADFSAAVEAIWRAVPALRIVMPTLPRRRKDIDNLVRRWPVQPIVTDDPGEKTAAFAAGNAAMAASGTVALELAMARVPMVIAYKVSEASARVVRHLLHVPFANLINLILERPVVPELLQEDCTPENLAEAVLPLLTDPSLRAVQMAALDEATAQMGRGGWRPSDRAAEIVLKYL